MLFDCIAVMGFFMRFEDDSVESAKIVKQWNVKIISVSIFTLLSCFDFIREYHCIFPCSIVLINIINVQISKNKRHQDRAAALEVWDRLEEFVRSRSHS